MSHRITSTLRAALVACLALFAPVAHEPLAGQAPEGTPTLLVIPETFPDIAARVVLLREPGRNVIVMKKSDASAETLRAALSVLRRHRNEAARPGRGQMIPVTGFVQTRPLEGAQRDRLDAALARLMDRPVAPIGNLGMGRSMPFLDRGP